MTREDLTFSSGDGWCAAWLYRPATATAGSSGDVPCVLMAHGFSLTRHDGLPRYAERLADAGVAVLLFDHRHVGDSSGTPRQRFRARLQREDWRSAAAFARTLPGVDGGRLVLWGYSFSASTSSSWRRPSPTPSRRPSSCARSWTGWRARWPPRPG